jgi:hypothetical protein
MSVDVLPAIVSIAGVVLSPHPVLRPAHERVTRGYRVETCLSGSDYVHRE